jgi:RNA 3'-terminal phosphate cyclase (ATP)
MGQKIVTIDGSHGEGGGQILRTALALSVVTRRPFRIVNIRANREPGGLRRQHLTAVTSAAAICGADVRGAHVESRELTFTPGAVRAGEYTFDVGGAGSTNLVLQTVLPPLLMADGESVLTLVGGTHNIYAPPFDFLEKAFLPLVRRMGAGVEIELERAGFYPRGGGRVGVWVTPRAGREKFVPIELHERGAAVYRRARAMVAGLRRDVAERELNVVRDELGFGDAELVVEERPADEGPGNIVTIELGYEHVTEVFTGFGERGVPAERVAAAAVAQSRKYVATGAPVGDCLADQLLVPLALAGGGAYTTGALTRHARTNINTIGLFLDVGIATRDAGEGRLRVDVGHGMEEHVRQSRDAGSASTR